ncbi:P12 family lipoprotein [Borrelia miyamotoi]|uniref:P12 family lipoprotein n=1 Tax=Borrelia miyamotoi TaxID=47466 RepID=A0AAQ2WXK6_9SPIR|nr:P12 family lipoprotein [Borrelia miyamotoi]QTL84341.1 P12 family lipoprotein [Borrelia miyamotoi]WAZ85800.1 P12 family lipoprotein [Borrelia miyamotoi]WAZ86012.1 P12 family lipoprotein [Borrelia miyamotoi]WAZ91795.1 P12 family lipoprotein [Borrelia miyamotoi]WAZ92874.1 P12 family lipoprotein [Borrelia miyamotoi]
MNKSVLAVCMLILLSLLSCDVNAFNEMIIKAREKYVEESKKVENLNSRDGNQEGEEGQSDIVGQHIEEGVKDVMQGVPVGPVNVDNVAIPVILNSPYYPQQEEIKIKEEDLVPSTNEEKEAQKEIEKAERVFQDSEFVKLTEEQIRGLKSEYEQLESSFYSTLSELRNKIGSYPRDNRRKRQEVTRFQRELNDRRFNVERLITQVDSGLYELGSAELFFNKAKGTLKEGITKRLRNKRRNSWGSRRGDSDLVARQARREAESALSQLESSSMKLIEAMGIKKAIEELIEDAKTVLEDLER